MDPRMFIQCPSDDFNCGICAGVLKRPLSCREGHNFCTECFHLWLEKSETCPVCKINVTKEEGLVHNRLVQRLIDQFRVRCAPLPDKDAKMQEATAVAEKIPLDIDHCAWEGSLESLEHHRAKECLFHPIPCQNEGCEIMITRPELERHEAACEFRRTDCFLCGVAVPAVDVELHRDVCTMVPTECPFGCPGSPMRGHECIVCPFSIDTGCVARFSTIGEMDTHTREAASTHADALLVALRHAQCFRDEPAIFHLQLESFMNQMESASLRNNGMRSLNSRIVCVRSKFSIYMMRVVVELKDANVGLFFEHVSGGEVFPVRLRGSTVKICGFGGMHVTKCFHQYNDACEQHKSYGFPKIVTLGELPRYLIDGALHVEAELVIGQ